MPSVTNINLMTPPMDTQLLKMKGNQQVSDDATNRLSGGFDTYSTHAGTAVIGIGADLQQEQYTKELQISQQLLLQQQQIDSQIGRTTQIRDNIRTYLVSLRNGISSLTADTIRSNISDFRNSLVSTLNETFGGDYLLGGSNRIALCVDATEAAASAEIGDAISYAYYKGGEDTVSIVLGGIPVTTCAVTAKDPAFAHVIHALKLMSSENLTNDPNDGLLTKAIETIDAATPYFGVVINTSATNSQNIQNASNKLTTLISQTGTAFKNALGSDEYQDIVQQMTAMHQLRIQESLIEDRLNSIKNMLNRI